MQAEAKTTSQATATVAGHFGEWLQGRLNPDGPVALISLPCPVLTVSARFDAADGFSVTQSSTILPDPTISAFLTALGLPRRGRWQLSAMMPPGGGAGASTASLLALAKAAAPGLAPDALARACVAAEGASDPLMFDDMETRLWASRQGVALRRLPACPAFDVVGGFWQLGERTNPADMNFPDIADLIEPWIAATRAGDRAGIARLATTSATRTTVLRGPADDPTAKLATELGALGWVRAHTGSARGLLFAPGTAPTGAVDHLTRHGYGAARLFSTGDPT